MLRRTAARFTDAFVAVSDTTAAFARDHRECAEHKLGVIRNGTDLSRFGRDPEARARLRAELGIAPDAWVVGTIGRFVAEKNHELLVRAAAPSLARGAHLVIAGGGVLEDEIRRAVGERQHRDRIHILGLRSDVPALLAAFDVFAISSRTEGLPIALIEAMASELPIVSTSVGGIPGVIDDGRTGLLVAPGDPAALGCALERVMTDASLAEMLAKRGRDVAVSELSAERMNADYLSLYDTVLQERRPWKTRFAKS
jgi:glycosyltransferase involved in cell wall biosynthesis